MEDEIISSLGSIGSCLACGSSLVGSSPYLTTNYKSTSLFEDLEIKYCRDCGFGWSWPECDATQLNEFYCHHYRWTAPDFQKLIEPVVINRRAVAQLLLAIQHTDFRTGDMMLDFGPGGGASFSAARQMLESPELSAVELNVDAAEAYFRLYGATTYRDVEALVASGAKPKIILASHSMEHLRLGDLTEFLGRVSVLIADGGAFVAEVPHVDMRLHREKRRHDDPHLLFFSLDSIRRIFFGAGLDVLFANTCSTPYDTWWTASSGNHRQGKSGVIRSILSRLPLERQSSIVRRYHTIRRDKLSFKSDDFHYGGDRVCLRIVAGRSNNVTANTS